VNLPPPSRCDPDIDGPGDPSLPTKPNQEARGAMLRLAPGHFSFWLRGIVHGAILGTLFAIVIGLASAAARNEQPFRRGKLVSAHSMDVVVSIGIPVAAPLGAILGIGLAESLWRRRRRTFDASARHAS
jgi:hypothetical protein